MRGLLLAGAGQVAAAAAVYAGCVLTPAGQRAEDALHAVTSTRESPHLLTREVTGPLVTGLDPLYLLLGAAVVVLVAVVRGRWLRAAVALAVLVVPIGVTEVLKHLVLPRPGFTSGVGTTLHNSFPSGHTTAGVALVLALVLTLPSRLRRVAALPGAAAVAVLAATVVDEGWHRVSDVLGSVLLTGGVWCAALAVVLLREGPRAGVPRPAAVRVAGLVPPVACAGALAVAYLLPGVPPAGAVLAPAAAAAAAVLAGTAPARSGEDGDQRAG